MRKHLNWIFAATLGLSGAAFMGCERSSTSTTTATPIATWARSGTS